jgi:hypothetical protein
MWRAAWFTSGIRAGPILAVVSAAANIFAPGWPISRSKRRIYLKRSAASAIAMPTIQNDTSLAPLAHGWIGSHTPHLDSINSLHNANMATVIVAGSIATCSVVRRSTKAMPHPTCASCAIVSPRKIFIKKGGDAQ